MIEFVLIEMNCEESRKTFKSFSYLFIMNICVNARHNRVINNQLFAGLTSA